MFDILLSPPDTGDLEREYVDRAISSGWVAPAGPDLVAFEEEVAARVGVEHAVGLSSGTAALHLALVAWGVQPGDVIPVSTLTFAASVNPILYVGAVPHFIDCAEDSGNMSPLLLEQALVELRRQGRRVPAVLPVDLLGKCVEHEVIAAVAAAQGARVLSDSAESFGATHNARSAGALSEANVLSFNGNKIMTTSGGGMLLTDDRSLADHVRKLSTQAREPVPHYEHTEIGYNYRLSNILAALGRAQLSRLDTMLARRRQWRERYRACFAESSGVRILGGADDTEDNCWLTAVTVDPTLSSWTSAQLGEAMGAAGIETRPLWKPMHQQPVFTGYDGTLDGTADRLFAQGLSLPSGSVMTDEQFARIESVIARVVAR